MARQYLLSIDGGGVRGVIPAMALAKLEETTRRLTRDIFSFVAGTSTGAIIAALVAAGVPAARILSLYEERAKEIFPRRPWNTLKRVVFGSMYSIRKLHDVLAEELGAAKDWRLNDAGLHLLITAKRVPDGMPWYFVRDTELNSGCTGRLRLADCVTASAAGPTYFPPWSIDPPVHVPDYCGPIGHLVDGGVGVTGNPVYQACVEAFDYTVGYEPSQTTTVSLGTGRFISDSSPTWIGSWLEWVLRQLLESPGEQQTQITWRRYPEMILYRIDTELKQDIRLDDARSVGRLKEYGQRLADQIDWDAILAGTDTRFRIGPHKTLWMQYKKESAP